MSTQAPTISLVAGTTYRFSATWASDDAHATPIDLTGCEAVFAVVSYQGETLLTCETGNGIDLAPEDGGIHLHLRPEQTAGPVAQHVVTDHRVARGQGRRLRRPHIEVEADAVDQNHRRAIAVDAEMGAGVDPGAHGAVERGWPESGRRPCKRVIVPGTP